MWWEKPFDPERDSITYDLVLNDETVVHDLTETDHTLGGLASSTRYSLTVVAKDGHGNEVPRSLTFKTPETGGELSYVKEQYGGHLREYGIYLPSGTGAGNLPLVISLHGWGGIVWPDMITDYFVTLAEKEQFILLKPQAMADPQGNIAWRDPVDLAFIDRLIDTVTVRHQVDMERVYLTGHSNGAFMTYILAKALEYKLAAIGPIAGTLANKDYANYSLLKPMPLCHIHGTADSTVQVQGNPTHVSFDKILEFFIPNNNCLSDPTVVELPDLYKYDNSTVTRITYNTQGISSGDIVYYRINNGNHSVPGTTSWANKDIHAYDVLWAFFKTRKLSDK
jgi:polyhydroxybutyrate depolymerase